VRLTYLYPEVNYSTTYIPQSCKDFVTGTQVFSTGVAQKIDCEGMARIVLARGLIMTLGPGMYKQLGFTSAPIVKLTLPELGSLKEGDWAYFANNPLYPANLGGYMGENVIKVAPDFYFAWPDGTKTYNGWIQRLATALQSFYPFATVNNVPGYLLNGKPAKPVCFLDVLQIATKVFDKRSGSD